MTSCGWFSMIKKKKDMKEIEKVEKQKDEFCDTFYTNSAKKHLNRILETYNRKPHHSFEQSLNSIKNIGLYDPCADNLNYLKHMRWVSMRY